ncbi:hypothetical protein AVENLUH5627_02022 [Acinetobacter venetianus]|uniref:Uncharacterized protein n=1 Tax=Acinetobacter venetianus TaxID=52133 RepID=A0A150HN74_9GAMM|nr:hypothetical protein AVENLUH5627_02022 [Acinetobacter venetianus]
MRTDMLFILLTVSFLYLIRCKSKIKNLEVKINYDHLCVFTNNSKTYYGNPPKIKGCKSRIFS